LIDDKSYKNFINISISSVSLKASNGENLNLIDICKSKVILYFYPRTGIHDKQGGWIDPASNWDNIPGAVGCTSQSLGFNTLNRKFNQLGYTIYGINTQQHEQQIEFVKRNQITFLLLSDEKFEFLNALKIPNFIADGRIFYKRSAWLI
jgi:peroxiredoxin